ncbi:hypothetical protein V8E36_002876 [Tilletia maclaganii]
MEKVDTSSNEPDDADTSNSTDDADRTLQAMDSTSHEGGCSGASVPNPPIGMMWNAFYPLQDPDVISEPDGNRTPVAVTSQTITPGLATPLSPRSYPLSPPSSAGLGSGRLQLNGSDLRSAATLQHAPTVPLSPQTSPKSSSQATSFGKSSKRKSTDMTPALGKVVSASPNKKRRTTVSTSVAAEAVEASTPSKPPRGQLRYRDRVDDNTSRTGQSYRNSIATQTPAKHSGITFSAPPSSTSRFTVSLDSIDRSKSLTKEQILGYNAKYPPKPSPSISCAIQDEELSDAAKAALAATRARLNLKEPLVRPPENAITNVVSADMSPAEAADALKWSRVAMREAKQTQAMLMYAMDTSEGRRRQSRVQFAVPDQRVYTLLVGDGAQGDGAGTLGLDGTSSAEVQNKSMNGLVSAMRGDSSQGADAPRLSSFASDSSGSTGGGGSSFSSARQSISSIGSAESYIGLPLTFNVAPPVPAYTFAPPTFAIPGDFAGSTFGSLLGSQTTGDLSAIPPQSAAAPGVNWELALQAQAANLLNTYQLPSTQAPFGPIGALTMPAAISTSTVPLSLPSTLTGDALQMPTIPPAAATTSTVTDTLLPAPSLSTFAGLTLTGDPTLPTMDLMPGMMNPMVSQRAITATGIERLLGSATIADTTRSLPEPAMNPCALYPPGQLIASQEWLQQQRFAGMVEAEPQLLPQLSPVSISAPAMANPSGTLLDPMMSLAPTVSAAPAVATSSSAALALPAPTPASKGKRKSVDEEAEGGEGWTSAYPPPLPGGRGTKKRGRPRSRSDVPPKVQPAAQASSSSTASEPVMHGPELPPGVKKDVPIAAPSLIPLRICAPVARRGVGRNASGSVGSGSASPSGSASGGTSGSVSSSINALTAGLTASVSRRSSMQPPIIEEAVDSSTCPTPQPLPTNRVRAATMSTLTLPSFTDAGAASTSPFPAASPTASLQPSEPIAGASGSSSSSGAAAGRPKKSTTARSGITRQSSTSSNSAGLTSTIPIIEFDTIDPSTDIPRATTSTQTLSVPSLPESSTTESSGTARSRGNSVGDLMFVTYGMEDASELRNGVAPSGNYKVPLAQKRRKMA